MKINFDLYLITDRNLTGGRELDGIVADSIRGGVRAVQLREKGLSDRDLLSLAYRLKAIADKKGVKLFINDRLDIALAVDADGIHLGHGSVTPKEARRILDNKKLIGVSTHSLDEALRARDEGADFVTIGPVFDTPSKRVYGKPVGLKVLNEVAQKLDIPVFAIGGIKRETVEEVIMAGAFGVALISAIIAAKNPGEATNALLKEIKYWKHKGDEKRRIR